MGMAAAAICPVSCQCLGFRTLDVVLNSGEIVVGDTIPRVAFAPSDYRNNNLTYAIVGEINAFYGTHLTVREEYGTVVSGTSSPEVLDAIVAGTLDVTQNVYSFAGVFRGYQRGYLPLIQPTCAATVLLGNIMVPTGKTLADIKDPNGGIKLCVNGAGSQSVYQAALGLSIELLSSDSDKIFPTNQDYLAYLLTNPHGCNAWPDTSVEAIVDPAGFDGSENPATVAAISAAFGDVPAAFAAPNGAFVKC